MTGLFSRKHFLYSPAEIAEHQTMIDRLVKDKEKALQHITLSKNDKTRPDGEYLNLEKTLTIITANIHTAELSLSHMLQSNERRYKRAIQA